LFVFVVVCLVLFSIVAAAFLANKDVYIISSRDSEKETNGYYLLFFLFLVTTRCLVNKIVH